MHVWSPGQAAPTFSHTQPHTVVAHELLRRGHNVRWLAALREERFLDRLDVPKDRRILFDDPYTEPLMVRSCSQQGLGLQRGS